MHPSILLSATHLQWIKVFICFISATQNTIITTAIAASVHRVNRSGDATPRYRGDAVDDALMAGCGDSDALLRARNDDATTLFTVGRAWRHRPYSTHHIPRPCPTNSYTTAATTPRRMKLMKKRFYLRAYTPCPEI